MKQLVVFALFIIITSNLQAQTTYSGFPSLVWPRLYAITYQKDPTGEFDKPLFTKEVKMLAGKEIVLPGYIIPFQNGMKDSHFMLSSLPINACFFCGVGGPEGVVEVFLRKPITYTDKPVEVKGRLVLNDSNPDKMIYILENAEFLGEIDF
ncbi:MAG TPA: hypothetical protein PLM56_13890 [Cyclobacteriaceae bacterium]|jgi:hypothetical protein|nr:hypothetical protein [Cytophagales bacterium]HNT50454.1 hypothetical protein [Cyclobacteriaceae bacterium]HRE65572.1 hypothetical protein [Cyclobacteriaceae bacterium]HRF34592.1 hypothetical protein [Cyclobacteriaceae bacterium]